MLHSSEFIFYTLGLAGDTQVPEASHPSFTSPREEEAKLVDLEQAVGLYDERVLKNREVSAEHAAVVTFITTQIMHLAEINTVLIEEMQKQRALLTDLLATDIFLIIRGRVTHVEPQKQEYTVGQ